MLLLTPLKKVPFEGHFHGGLHDESICRTSVSRVMARCCTIAAMGWLKNSDLRGWNLAFATFVNAGLPSVAWAGTPVRPDSAQLLAAVCVGALIVLVAVAIAQRRRPPTSPPSGAVASPRALAYPDPVVACPRCQSNATERLSEFGSTPCKALYRCTACLEPFDYFKCL